MLIGLTGNKGTGKTTIAKYLQNNHDFKRYSFADPLKEMLINAGMCTYKELYEEKTEFSRWLMQRIGTDIFRKQVSQNYWTDVLLQKLHICQDKNVVVDDVRFVNEYDSLRRFSPPTLGKLTFIRVVRRSFEADNHESELQVAKIPVTYTIVNNGTIEELINKIVDTLNNIVGGF